MKKPILLMACIVCATVMVNAQAQFALGLKAGPNFANINTEATAGENYKSRTGFHAGAFALFKFTQFGIQPEVLFSQQGSKVRVNTEDFDANYSYINIPVMIKLYTVAGINLQAGPQFGFLASAKQEIIDDLGNRRTEDVKDQFKGSDISLALGAGWDLPFGLTIDGRYNWGLTDINDTAAPNTVKNQVWQISVGYKFIKLGK
jgi:Outer membrane protein beta-barrel domain